MAFEKAREAGTFLHEFRWQKEMVEKAALNTVQALVASGECPASLADDLLLELTYHARLRAFQMWECLNSPEAPPVPSHF